MKKTGVILGAVCILAAVLYFLVTARMGKVTAADFLSAETLVCIEQRDLGPLLDEFKGSRLGRAAAGIDYVKIATDLGLAPEEINKVKDTGKQVDDFINSPIFKEILGQQFTAALLPVADGNQDSPEQMAEKGLLLIAKPRHSTDILKVLSSLFTSKLEQTDIEHGRHTITQYLIEEDKTLNVVTVKGYVIAAFDQRLVQESLDRYDGKQGSLAQSKEYLRLRRDFKDAKLFTYISLPKFHELAVRMTESLDPAQKEEMQAALAQWKGWKGMAFGAWKEKGKIRDKAVVLFKKDELDPFMAKMCGVQPGKNKTLAMVPADIIGYYWTNTLDMNAFWTIFSQEMKDNAEQLKALEGEVKSATGVELQPLLAMFGSEAVILLKEVATDGFIPLPNGALFVQIKNEADFVKVLQTLLTKIDIPIQTEEYKGVKLNSLGVSLHPSLKPVYALHQGYLILASTVDLVKKVIDSQAGGGLAADAGFQQANQGLQQGLTKDNNSISIIRFAALLQLMKELSNWGGTMLSMQDPEVAVKSKVVIEQLIHPLLDGLAMYDVVGSHSLVRDDALIMESITVLAP